MRRVDINAIINNLDLVKRRLASGNTNEAARFMAQDLIALLGPSAARAILESQAEALKDIFCYQEHRGV